MQPTVIKEQTELTRNLNLVIREGLASQAMTILTSGTFLIAYALNLGATDLQIGLITSIPLFANILQVVSIYLVQRAGSRKRVVVTCTAIGRSSYLLLALLPFLAVGQAGIYIMLLVLGLQCSMGAVSTGGWNSWMRDVIPQNCLGSFFSKRLMLSQIVSITLCLGCAVFLDHIMKLNAEFEVYGYALLFLGGAICGIVAVYLLSRTYEPPMQSKSRPLLQLIRKPFRHRNFRNLMFFMACWNFALNLSVPFMAVYMLKTLDLNLTTVIGLTTVTQVANILFFRLWGHFADKYGAKAILLICGPLYLGCILAWIFTTQPGVHTFTLPLLIIIHFVSGIATAGTGLASSSMGIKLAPKKDSVAYLSLLSFTNAITAGIAPLLSGWLAGLLVNKSLSWSVNGLWLGYDADIFLLHLQHWDFFFIFTFIFGLFAVYRLRKIKEKVSSEVVFSVEIFRKEIALMIEEVYLQQKVQWTGLISASKIYIYNLSRPKGMVAGLVYRKKLLNSIFIICLCLFS